jgi:hypothetical protein
MFEMSGSSVGLGLMGSKKQVKCEHLAVSPHNFSLFILALIDFCAKNNGENVIYKVFSFAVIWLHECSSGILLIHSGFLIFLWLW